MNKRVLLVDSDKSLRHTLSKLLTSNGYKVDQADSKDRMRKVISKNMPDLIVLDTDIAGKSDGLCSDIMTDPDTQGIPVIFLVKKTDSETERSTFNVAGDDFLLKPFDIKDLLIRVQAQFKRVESNAKTADYDELTQLFSRSYFLTKLKLELNSAHRINRIFCIAMIDLDNFKQINDNYNHSTGNFVLKHFSFFLQDNLRKADLLARYSGKEFILIIKDIKLKQAYDIINRLRKHAEIKEFEDKETNFATKITFSAGIAEYPKDGEDVLELIQNSEKALYKAKTMGKNRVEILTEDDTVYDPDEKKKRILVVDDDLDIIKLIKAKLQQDNFSVLEAYNGKEAIELTKKFNPDLIVMDIVMPVMDGLEACRILKKDHSTRFIPLILLSGKSSEEDITKGFDLGADDYINKPFSPDELMARVKRYIYKK